MEYKEDEFLNISGIQHFIYCRRQWALIHIEQQWVESYHTVDGELFHENAHDGYVSQKRNDVISSKGMAVKSYSLGIDGVCDVVEFIKNEDGIKIFGREGLWKVYPIEYKRGSAKEDDCDVLQLTAQALCLEQMLCCTIDYGFLYYGKTRHRQKILFDEELRAKTKQVFEEMHSYYVRRYTPRVKKTKKCNLCSLSNICLPKLNSTGSVKDYIAKSQLGEDV